MNRESKSLLGVGSALGTAALATAAWLGVGIAPCLAGSYEAIHQAAAIGDDDGLCETDEHCLFTPNISSYQGHGALISAGAFTDGGAGGLTGITLWKYENNGY